MNEVGVIVGNYLSDDGRNYAFVWAPLNNPAAESGLDLGTLGGYWTRAKDIADNGKVVGTSQNALGLTRSFVWSPTSEITEVPTLGGFTSRSSALSDNGLYQVGTSQTAMGFDHAYIVTATKLRQSGSAPPRALTPLMFESNGGSKSAGGGPNCDLFPQEIQSTCRIMKSGKES
nr:MULTISPECIES: hypothetical protein [unclassified Lysobacter]